MVRPCTCVQQMPTHLYKAWEFLEEYKKTLDQTIPKNRFEAITYFIFKLRDFLLGASQNDHGVVSLQNRGEHWILLKDENNSPYQLINSEFEAYVRPALPYLKEQYTCGWDQSDALVTMVVKQFFFAGR
jgi:hypothetical protein